MTGRAASGRAVFIVDARRTPFLRSGSEFRELCAYDLGRMAIAGLLHKSGVDRTTIDRVVLGTVVADPDTSNVARESALAGGVPASCPANTVTAACISANIAFEQAAHAIATGEADVAIAGGTETLSDVPIRVSRAVRKRLIAARKVRGIGGWLALLRGLRPRDLLPVVPAIADFSTGLTMGQNAERLAKRIGISRHDQDEYAMLSHHRAAEAAGRGWLDSQIVPARLPREFRPIDRDNGIRGDTSMEKLAELKPAFDRRFGTITAGNSSYLTDGASAVLLASEDGLAETGLPPLARVVSQAVSAMDPLEELLLGPSFAIPAALDRAGLTLGDLDVIELHEAFAAQVLAVIRLLADARFARDSLSRDRAVGRIDIERTNRWGGSLSVGHPFGATGGRLVANCCRRLIHEDGRFGLVAACASGALGYAMVVERVG
ncbi:MAG TPA: acetyl-CoA C-acyltransferase [Candidatus Polarisedimenticolaceae bacterium]|nr:acetyl-CoA C-acyltransferase [Candidatus Polarisedimenticolaceae bacterium]